MLEKAARRACESFPARGGRVCDYPDCGCAPLALQAARDILTAIREPDVNLRLAGDIATMRHRGDAAKMWPEMIDAILAEKPKS